MAKLKTVYVCQQCGNSSAKWLGQCPSCGGWNTLVEEVQEVLSKASAKTRGLTDFSSDPVKLSEADSILSPHSVVGIEELDRVLGGGLVAGQVTLLAGPPGIGKSTLMLEASFAMSKGLAAGGKVLYVSGEESLAQVGSRAKRLGASADNIYLMSETNLAKVLEAFHSIKPAALVVDSIQTLYHPEFAGSPGSVGQIRECACELLKVVKLSGSRLFILGHVTKDGALAGPRVLEHIVDTVLYFDSEKHNVYRILRSHKNRFGSVSEIGLFEMTAQGLRSVADASGVMAGTDRSKALAGRAFSVAFEGTRPVLAEVQVLASRSYFPYPRRTVTGMDLNRTQMLIASVEKNVGLSLDNMDVFASVLGGLKIKDTAIDMAFCAALISSARDIALRADWAFIGEVGILAQTSGAGMMERRIAEAERMGFTKIFVPKLPAKDMSAAKKAQFEIIEDMGGLFSALKKGTGASAPARKTKVQGEN